MIKRRKTPRPKALWVQIDDEFEVLMKPGQKIKTEADIVGRMIHRRRKPVRKISPAKRERMKEYESAKHMYLMGRTKCERCGWKTEKLDLHHRRGRWGSLLTDARYFAALCRLCHSWAHQFPKLAREGGWLAGPGEWGKQK